MPVGQKPGEAKEQMWTRKLDSHTRTGVQNVGSAQCQIHLRRKHKTKHKGYTPSPRIEINSNLGVRVEKQEHYRPHDGNGLSCLKKHMKGTGEKTIDVKKMKK